MRFKRTVSVLLAVLMLLSALCVGSFAEDADFEPIGASDLLHTEGEKIVNADGEEVVLRGTNFGGWGIMEDWFCPITSPSGEEEVFLTLVDRFGLEAAHELMKLYRENWITEQDYRNVAELGMNVVRLPIWYRNFQSEPGVWYTGDDGEPDLSELDGVVELCGRYGLYLIIDLHGLPGYQNDYDHCGRSKSMSFFDDTEEAAACRDAVKDFWVTVAERYKDSPVIAMYDFMNEPLGTGVASEASMRQTFYDYLDELYDAVRAVDPDHIITMEAIWSPDALPAPDVYGWENVVYQEHLYDVTNPTILRKANEITKADYGIPFLIGEFYPRGLTTFGYLLSIFNKRGLSWTTWTYKGAGPKADDSPWFIYGSSTIEKIDYENDSYETLCEKFGEVLRTDSGEFSRTSFADYVAHFAAGEIDEASLYTFGLIETVGTAKERLAMFRAKLQAMVTTVRDWLRKLKTGDLL